jgi:hypothetical protein
MRARRTTATVIATVLGGLTLASACAGSGAGGSGAARATGVAGTTVPEPATTPLDVTGVALEPGDPYCGAVLGIGRLDLPQLRAGGDDPELGNGVAEARAALADAGGAAPAELRTEWELVAGAYGRLLGAFQDAGYDPAALMADPSAATVFEELSSQSVTAAAASIERYTLARCGTALGLGDAGETIELDDSPSAAPPAAPETAPLLDDAAAIQLGGELVAGLGLAATADQQACLGRAVSDPAIVARATDSAAGDEPVYARLARDCGIEVPVSSP